LFSITNVPNCLSTKIMTKIIYGANGQDGQILKKIDPMENFIEISANKVGNLIVSNDETLRRDTIESIFVNKQIDEIFFLSSINSSAIVTNDYDELLMLQKNVKLVFDDFLFVIEMVRKFAPKAKIFFASSALIFGLPLNKTQDESQAYKPVEFYSLFKIICHDIINYYRENKNIFITCGILYPHESEFRKPNYLFRKIIDHSELVRRKPGSSPLLISDLQFTREWNCAYQIMKCVVEILKHENPVDLVIGSGVQHSIEDLCKLAYAYFNLDFKQFVLEQKTELIKRSPNLAAQPTKLMEIIGYKPDGDLKALVKRTYSNLGVMLN